MLQMPALLTTGGSLPQPAQPAKAAEGTDSAAFLFEILQQDGAPLPQPAFALPAIAVSEDQKPEDGEAEILPEAVTIKELPVTPASGEKMPDPRENVPEKLSHVQERGHEKQVAALPTSVAVPGMIAGVTPADSAAKAAEAALPAAVPIGAVGVAPARAGLLTDAPLQQGGAVGEAEVGLKRSKPDVRGGVQSAISANLLRSLPGMEQAMTAPVHSPAKGGESAESAPVPQPVADAPDLPFVVATPEAAEDAAPQTRTAAEPMHFAATERVSYSFTPAARIDAPRIAELPQPLAAQVAQAISSSPDGQVELSLSPEELGGVRLRFSPGQGDMLVVVQADRPETLDLFRKNADMLAQEFKNLGYGSVAFEFGQRGQQKHAATSQNDLNDPLQVQPEAAVTVRLNLAPDAGLDLRL